MAVQMSPVSENIPELQRYVDPAAATDVLDTARLRFHYGAIPINRAPEMPNLTIRNVPADVVARLHERAAANHRSLQGELMALVTSAVSGARPQVDRAAREHRGGYKSIDQISAEHRERVKRPLRKGDRSVDLIRADRDAH